MMTKFLRVETRYAWTTGARAQPGGVCGADVVRGFAGYNNTDEKWAVISGVPDMSAYAGPALSQKKLRACPGALSPAIPYAFFKQHCRIGDWALDLMCGLGSAAVAGLCHMLNTVSVDVNKAMVCLFILHMSAVQMVPFHRWMTTYSSSS